MPNLYNRPRWSLGRLVATIRYRTSLPGLFLLLVSTLLLLGGLHLPAELAGGFSGLDVQTLPWRARATCLLASPLGRLLELPGWLSGGAAPEIALLLLQALAAGGAVTLTVRWLLRIGVGEILSLQVGLLLSFATCLGAATWQLGPETLATLAVSGALLFGWTHHQEGHLRDALSSLACLVTGALVDPRVLLLLLPLTHLCLRTSPRPSPRLRRGLAVAMVLACFWIHARFLLHPRELAYLLAHLAPGQVLRRLLATLTGAGSCLWLALPPLGIALAGLPSLLREERRLGLLCLQSLGLLLLGRLLLVHDLGEASVPLWAYASLLPALAPPFAYGLRRLQESRPGRWGILLTCLAGAALQASALLIDPGYPMRALETHQMDFPLDRSFTPELSAPVLGLRTLVAHLRGDPTLELWLPTLYGVPGRAPIQVDLAALAPRPWPWRLARWSPPADLDPPVRLLERLSLGRRSYWLQVLGAMVYTGLICLLLLSLFSLWERNRRLWEILEEESRAEGFPAGLLPPLGDAPDAGSSEGSLEEAPGTKSGSEGQGRGILP